MKKYLLHITTGIKKLIGFIKLIYVKTVALLKATRRRFLKFIEAYSYLVPVVMLAVTLYSNFFSINYVVVGNILGYSLLSNIFVWLWFNRTPKKYCWFSRNVAFGLVVINLIDILGDFLNYSYYSSIFNTVVCSVCLTLFIIYKLSKL